MIIGGVFYIHKDSVTLIKTPPKSIAQWYKPTNKRQVWLHNMFKLRREMQAVRFYATNKDAAHMQKWAAQLSKHYKKTGEMVPEWKKKLDMGALANLEKHVKNNQYQEVTQALDDLGKSCTSCHADFRAITATMYRAPDFSTVDDISPSISLIDHMIKLTEQVNLIKIASNDGMQDIALSSLSDLKKGMNTLGDTCSTCHEDDEMDYPGDTINETINNLEQSLKTGTLKEQGRELGTLAVIACARCHGTHRLSYDSRQLFEDPQTWRELIRH
jgi:cytochrome c556